MKLPLLAIFKKRRDTIHLEVPGDNDVCDQWPEQGACPHQGLGLFKDRDGAFVITGHQYLALCVTKKKNKKFVRG